MEGRQLHSKGNQDGTRLCPSQECRSVVETAHKTMTVRENATYVETDGNIVSGERIFRFRNVTEQTPPPSRRSSIIAPDSAAVCIMIQYVRVQTFKQQRHLSNTLFPTRACYTESLSRHRIRTHCPPNILVQALLASCVHDASIGQLFCAVF